VYGDCPMTQDPHIRIEQLYPDYNPEQLARAAANLRRFAQVLLEIQSNAKYDEPQEFDCPPPLPYPSDERSNPTH
jgi:hypothetical protein